jgi:hypothetical protein
MNPAKDKSSRSVGGPLGKAAEAAKLEHQDLGIESPSQPGWTKREIRLLGTRPDREIARGTGRSTSAVQMKRLSLGIPCFRAGSPKVRDPIEPEKVKLFYGPYTPPRTRRGRFLFCELRGTVKVGEYSDGPIPWPMKWGTWSIILCGDLVPAVKQESELAVAHHWGVSVGTVTKWRNALEVPPMTPGTRRLKSFLTSETMTPSFRAYIGKLKTGKPRNLTPEGEARLMAAIHKPKSQRWRQRMAKHFAARRGKLVDPNDRPWTPEEEKVLGTKPDRQVAALLKRSIGAVISRRRLKGVAYINPYLRPWTASELRMLGKLPDPEVVRRTGHTIKGVQGKRQELGMLVRPHSIAWTADEEKLLGTRTDNEAARLLKRSRPSVAKRRLALGIAASGQHANYTFWTRTEDQLLGTASDAAVARKIGRTSGGVQRRRLALGLLSRREQLLRSKEKRE